MSLDCTLSGSELAAYVLRQMDYLFPDGRGLDAAAVEPVVGKALERLDHCLNHSIWYSKRQGPGSASPKFNHLYSDHYALFLAYLANSSVGVLPGWFTDKVYCLNKALHALDIGAHVDLPAVFAVTHGLGSVIGRARLGDYLMIYQGCTIGGSPDLHYPEFGDGVVMYAGSRVIGGCRIGGNVILSAGAQVVGQDIPADSVVFGQSPSLIIKPSRRDVIGEFFHAAGTP